MSSNSCNEADSMDAERHKLVNLLTAARHYRTLAYRNRDSERHHRFNTLVHIIAWKVGLYTPL